MESKRLLDQVRDKIRIKHYSIRTEDAYLHWIRRYVLSKRTLLQSYAGERHTWLLAIAS